MSDLVKWLRKVAPHGSYCAGPDVMEAADVLEAQAAELTRLREQCDAKDAEIERLKARLFPPDCPPADQERDHLAEQCATLLRENDSLRAKLDRAKEVAKLIYAECGNTPMPAMRQIVAGHANVIISELPADAPAQPKISDDVRSLLDEAIATLEKIDKFEISGLDSMVNQVFRLKNIARNALGRIR